MPETVTPAPAVETPAPAAPAAPAPAPTSVESFSPAQRREWLEKGAPAPRPEPAKPAPVSESEEPAPSPDVAAFVRTPPPPGVSKRQHEKNELVRAAKEAQARAERVEAELAALRSGSRPAETTPPAAATPPKDYDGLDPADPRPTLKDYPLDKYAESEDPYGERLVAYNQDLAEWKGRVQARISGARTEATTARTQFETRQQAYFDRMTAHGLTDAEFQRKTAEVRANIHPLSPMGKWVMDSPVAPQIIGHLADHPEDFTRIARAGSYEAAHAAFIRLEARFEAAAPSSSTPAADTPASAAPPLKLVSSAPPPPEPLGTRPAEPADESRAAVVRQDFRAFKDAEDRKEIARQRGR